jgi:hypothetical protein
VRIHQIISTLSASLLPRTPLNSASSRLVISLPQSLKNEPSYLLLVTVADAQGPMSDDVEVSIICIGVEAPEACSSDVLQARVKRCPNRRNNPQDDITVGTRIGHDLRRLLF